MAEPLSKVDSAVAGLQPETKDKKAAKKTESNVMNINELEEKGIELEIAIETQKLNWKLNTSPASLDDKEALKKPLTKPLVKKIDLQFPTGLQVTARNMKGVTIKDALDAIYKQFKKKADDELGDQPILAGFEWDKEESWTRLIVHQKKEGAQPSKKSKKKAGEE
ncbi:hypothetical protein VTO42DRAFT_5439 [Malbranchea cinnamomea]